MDLMPIVSLITFILGYGAGTFYPIYYSVRSWSNEQYEVFFTKRKPNAVSVIKKRVVADQIIRYINNTNKSIYIHAFHFTSESIGQAIVKALQRGVKVYMLVDKACKTSPHAQNVLQKIQKAGGEIWIDQAPRIAHCKVMIFDKTTVLTGSYNFTAGAENNTENVLFIKSQQLAKTYLEYWMERYNDPRVKPFSSNIITQDMDDF